MRGGKIDFFRRWLNAPGLDYVLEFYKHHWQHQVVDLKGLYLYDPARNCYFENLWFPETHERRGDWLLHVKRPTQDARQYKEASPFLAFPCQARGPKHPKSLPKHACL